MQVRRQIKSVQGTREAFRCVGCGLRLRSPHKDSLSTLDTSIKALVFEVGALVVLLWSMLLCQGEKADSGSERLLLMPMVIPVSGPYGLIFLRYASCGEEDFESKLFAKKLV